MEPFLGQLMLVAFNYPPKGWAFCAGQILPINQNQALFALLGTTFGGNGVNTFALPDLRGRAAMGFGQGAGLPNYNLGQVSGTESVTLIQSQLPTHTHQLSGSTNVQSVASPAGNALAELTNQSNFNVYKANGVPAGTLNPASVSNFGGSQPHTNQAPYLTMNWVIALQGIFPSRN